MGILPATDEDKTMVDMIVSYWFLWNITFLISISITQWLMRTDPTRYPPDLQDRLEERGWDIVITIIAMIVIVASVILFMVALIVHTFNFAQWFVSFLQMGRV